VLGGASEERSTSRLLICSSQALQAKFQRYPPFLWPVSSRVCPVVPAVSDRSRRVSAAAMVLATVEKLDGITRPLRIPEPGEGATQDLKNPVMVLMPVPRQVRRWAGRLATDIWHLWISS
jgi:hypothetical protein